MSDREDPLELQTWRRDYRALQSPGGPNCPSETVLVALVLGELAGSELDQVASHVIACQSCSEDVTLLMRVDEAAAPPLRSRWAGWRRPLAIAASILLAGVGLALLTLRRGPSLPSLDDAPGAGATRQGNAGASADALQPPQGADLDAPPATLAWRAVEEARRYEVTLLTSRGDVLFKSEVTSATADLPPEVRARLQPKSTYVWRVDVEGKHAESRLGPFWFRLR